MPARFSEIIILAAAVIALFAAVFILPRIEKKETEARHSRWMIIDREFIDFQEDCNG